MRTYGTAKLVGRVWEIQAEPHVMLRLRRLFQGADKTGETVLITNTIQNARDLEWVCERFPLDVDPRDTMRAQAERHREAEAAIARMSSADYVPRPVKLHGVTPRGYQMAAAELALRMRGLLIADDLGLGKTITAICALIEPSSRPALIVTPTALPRQWESVFAQVAPELRVHRIRDGELYDIAERAAGRRRKNAPPSHFSLFAYADIDIAPRFPDVIITSYSKIVKWAPFLTPHIRSVTFDEVQELRNDASQKYRAAESLSDVCDLRIGLSATPFHNYGGELFDVMEILMPGALGDWGEFRATWCAADSDSYGRKPMLKDPNAFGLWAREQGFMIRRTRAEVKRELPAISRIVHTIDTDQAPIAAIEGRAMELARIIVARHGHTNLERMEAASEISYLLRHATGVGKAPHIADFVRLLVENGERVLVFAWHHDVYAILAERLKDLGVALYTGQESAAGKERSKAEFVSGKAQVLLMSLRSAAGVDGLQAVCSVVVHAELDWSPAVHNQDDGRVHRDGQTKPVMSYYCVSESGSDPVVWDVLGIKTGQIQPMLDPDAPVVGTTQIDPDHVRQLATRYLEKVGGALPENVSVLGAHRRKDSEVTQ